MREGFTLGEVLITLAIIGIVAALTIPTLMANIQGTGNRSKFKKGISTLQQAGRMSLAKKGFSFGDTNAYCGEGRIDYCSENSAGDGADENAIHSICAVLETGLQTYSYFPPSRDKDDTDRLLDIYENSTTIVINRNDLRSPYYFGYYLLPDGIGVGVYLPRPDFGCSVANGEKFDSKWINTHHHCIGFIDVNGPNGPNKEVECSDGVETANDVDNPCVVKTKDITDMFPIAFYDATVAPASNAAAYVLHSAK